MKTRAGGNKSTDNETSPSADTITTMLPQLMEEIASSIRRSNDQIIDLFHSINNDLIQAIQTQEEHEIASKNVSMNDKQMKRRRKNC